MVLADLRDTTRVCAACVLRQFFSALIPTSAAWTFQFDRRRCAADVAANGNFHDLPSLFDAK